MSHLSKTLVVNSFENPRILKEIVKENGIDVPRMIIYTFDATLIEEAKAIPGYEILPIPIMNILMEYGRNHIVSMFYTNATWQYLI